jgi:hypothetical protein
MVVVFVMPASDITVKALISWNRNPRPFNQDAMHTEALISSTSRSTVSTSRLSAGHVEPFDQEDWQSGGGTLA